MSDVAQVLEEHVFGEAICVLCGSRNIILYQNEVLLKDILCESCGHTGGVILTGESQANLKELI